MPLHRRILADPVGLRSWLLIAAAAVVVAALVGHVVSRAEATRAEWGETRQVLVAARGVRSGELLDGATELRRWPVALVPVGALDAPPPASARTGVGVSAGSPITQATLRSPNATTRDRPRIAVPLPDAHPPLHRGDQVDVWATTDPSLTDGRLATERVAAGATVISTDDRSATVAVDRQEIPDLASAASTSTIVVVVVG